MSNERAGITPLHIHRRGVPTVGSTPVDDLVQEGRVSGQVYRRDDVFEAELERIFHRTWVYVAHESEIPDVGDFKTTTIGRQPVIVVRAPDESVGIFFNRCRHRAASVCEERSGNTRFFRCPYHGWTYRTDGRLAGVPYPESYGGLLDKSVLGLAPVARVGTYRGFVFANLVADGPTLLEHLGNAVPYLDLVADKDVALPEECYRYPYDANWKLQLENSGDNYHASVIHKVFFDLLEERMGQKIDISGPPGWRALDLGNGHGALDFRVGDLASELSALPFNLVVFPNLVVLGNQVRVVVPVSAQRTLVEMHPLHFTGADDAANLVRLRQFEDFYGPAGFGGPDDVAVAMERVARGLAADGGDDWLHTSRGLTTATTDEATGVRTGHVTDELPLQSLYRAWREAMSVEARTEATPAGAPCL